MYFNKKISEDKNELRTTTGEHMNPDLKTRQEDLEKKLFGAPFSEVKKMSLIRKAITSLRYTAILNTPVYGDYLLFKQARIDADFMQEINHEKMGSFNRYHIITTAGIMFKYSLIYDMICR